MHFRASRIVRVGLGLGVMWSTVRAETVAIQFSELDNYARSLSLRAQVIEQEFERTRADRDEDLQWSNFEFAYDRENVERLDEYQITIAKQFEVPWAYLETRSAWDVRMKSAEFQRAQSTLEHLAELKTGYVRLRLLDEYLSRLGQLKAILTDASHVATTRHTEGHLSGVEDHLIQMSVISLNASYQVAQQERGEIAARWRAALGLGPMDSASFVTAIVFVPVQLKSAEHYAGLVEAQPGIQSKALLQEALSKRASAERGKFIPTVTLYGGYKKMEPRFEGYVAGISFNLPLFNLNGAAARRYEVESRIVAHETRIHRSRAAGQIRALVQSIEDARLPLASVADHFDEDLEAFGSLLYSYEEGWMTLSELLNGIQIELSGLEDFYIQLSRYYENIFELEALTGQKLVHFTG